MQHQICEWPAPEEDGRSRGHILHPLSWTAPPTGRKRIARSLVLVAQGESLIPSKQEEV